MSASGVPRSISTTPGCSTAPETVTSDVPGSSTSPWARNASGPVRAIRATWARVSALCTRAPRRPMRRGTPLSGGTSAGTAARSIQRDERGLLAGDEAVGRPEHVSGTGEQPAAARSARAGAHRGGDVLAARGHAHRDRAAPQAAASSWAPSRTRCGERSRSSLSLSLAGSPSMPLTTTVPPRPPAWATASLMAAGKPGPAPAGQTRRPRARRRRPRATVRPAAWAGVPGRARPRGRPGRPGGRAAGSAPRRDEFAHARAIGEPPCRAGRAPGAWAASRRPQRVRVRVARLPARRRNTPGEGGGDGGTHTHPEDDDPGLARVGPHAEGVGQRHRPAQVGQPVQGAPGARPQPGAQQAGHEDGDHEVEAQWRRRRPRSGCSPEVNGTTTAAQPMWT